MAQGSQTSLTLSLLKKNKFNILSAILDLDIPLHTH